MALQTSLAKIKAVARNHAGIQALTDADAMVVLVLDWVVLQVNEDIYKTRTEEAQTYLAAHNLAQGFETGAGKGSLSSRSIGGVSQSWTMPYNNPKTQLGSTLWGSHYVELRRACVQPFVVIAV